jgi:hypothetical protein
VDWYWLALHNRNLFRVAHSAYIRKTGLCIIFEYRQGKINYFLFFVGHFFNLFFFRICGYKLIISLKKSRPKITGNFRTKSAWNEARFDLIGRHINLIHFSFKTFACHSKIQEIHISFKQHRISNCTGHCRTLQYSGRLRGEPFRRDFRDFS